MSGGCAGGRDQGCGCGCCAGVTAATPQAVQQRAGLPALAYRVGTHPQFLASLTAALTSTGRPALAGLDTRDPRDLTMALLDATATLCDVLTFYTERLAQESYLRTAVDRTSLQELGRLVAYRMRPGVAAATQLAFFVEPPPAAPAATGSPTEAFPAAPYLAAGGVELPAGLAVRSVPGPGEQPQAFETGQALLARPEWNALRPRRTRTTALGTGTGVGAGAAYLAGTGHNLRRGDMLLFTAVPPADPTDPFDVADPRPVTGVTVQPEEGRTLVEWFPHVSDLELPADPQVYAMRKRLSVFGYNAPPFDLLKDSTSTATDWAWKLSAVDGAVDVDGSHPDIGYGSWLVLTASPYQQHFLVTAVTELSRADYGISGKVTRVSVNGDLSDFAGKVRETVVHAASEKLPLAEEPDPSAVDGDEIVVDASVADLPPGRTLLVAGQDASFEPRVETVTLAEARAEAGGTRLTLTAELAEAYRRETVVVYGNVVAATHGETVHQVLGSGDGSRAHQAFELRHAPVTYVPSDDPSGATSTLSVRVNDVEWHEVPSLYPAGPDERSFVTRDTERGTVVAGFGDGVRGARLPTGQQNVRATYRRGLGVAGNVAAGAVSQVMDPPLGLTKVTNPAPATGGADPQAPDDAREAIPLPVRTLDRAVSLLDYADYARAFTGVAKASATVLTLPGGRTIVVTVAAAGGAPVPAEVCARL
ncbi:MAG TPA: baseplate J/gp47 family protein, partial [Micromonosporaceae bacterium]|nr:baseplate J/gp47 family protein [Micromonosporaceae bacterium]